VPSAPTITLGDGASVGGERKERHGCAGRVTKYGSSGDGTDGKGSSSKAVDIVVNEAHIMDG